jgi:hypothetical protein
MESEELRRVLQFVEEEGPDIVQELMSRLPETLRVQQSEITDFLQSAAQDFVTIVFERFEAEQRRIAAVGESNGSTLAQQIQQTPASDPSSEPFGVSSIGGGNIVLDDSLPALAMVASETSLSDNSTEIGLSTLPRGASIRAQTTLTPFDLFDSSSPGWLGSGVLDNDSNTQLAWVWPAIRELEQSTEQSGARGNCLQCPGKPSDIDDLFSCTHHSMGT